MNDNPYRAMTKAEIATAFGDHLRNMTPTEFAEWQEVRRRAHELGVTLPSDRPLFPPVGALFGGLF